MSSQREGPNPLRPYYIPPSVGPLPGNSPNTSPAHSLGSQTTSFRDKRASLGSSARDLLSDLDYSEYLTDQSPSATTVVKGFVDRALWKYLSVLLAQPFEVGKVLLQVQQAAAAAKLDPLQRPTAHREEQHNIFSDDSDLDSPSYFTSAAPLSHPSASHPPRPHRRNNRYRSQDSYSIPSPSLPETHTPFPLSSSHRLPSTTSITHVISSLWTTEGAWGIWKGTNSTFIHNILLSTITAFIRSLLCAALALPDPGLGVSQSEPPYLISIPSAVGGLDIMSSPNPFISLAAAVGAAGIAGIILAPIDIARTRLMLTPSTHAPRSLIPTLKALPSWTLPFSIAPVTFLHSTLPTLITASTPVFLRSRLGIDPVLTPNMYATATFLSQICELGVRLPVETVLRRGQMAVLRTPTSHHAGQSRSIDSNMSNVGLVDMQTSVELGPYKGLVGTMYHIVFEEGERAEPANGKDGRAKLPTVGSAKTGRRKKGQGLEGLLRGWRVGMWGLVGIWAAATLGGVAGKGAEF